MNILLVGGTCSLMNNIILKLRKEGHRVFLLTGDKYKHSKYEKVFERYDFPYDSENLNEIIESVNPDVRSCWELLTRTISGMARSVRRFILFRIW